MNDGQDDGINSYEDYIKALVRGRDFKYATDRKIGISMLLDMVPLLGEFKLGYEILVGKDLVSHISLSAEERGIIIATLGVGMLAKYGVGKIVGKGAHSIEGVPEAKDTVWDYIKATPSKDGLHSTYYEGTVIPRSFEISVEGKKMWVHGNGTKHINDEVIKQMAFTRDSNLRNFSNPIDYINKTCTV